MRKEYERRRVKKETFFFIHDTDSYQIERLLLVEKIIELDLLIDETVKNELIYTYEKISEVCSSSSALLIQQ